MKYKMLGAGLILVALLVAACNSLSLGGGRYTSNGERIYMSGTSVNGRISYSGGNIGNGMMGGQQLACASCHAPNARGGPHVMHMTAMNAPDIRWSTLTEAGHGDDGDHDQSGEMEHPPYDKTTFKRAVTQGLDPGGEPLDDDMPRWRMSEQDLDDLIAFLQTMD